MWRIATQRRLRVERRSPAVCYAVEEGRSEACPAQPQARRSSAIRPRHGRCRLSFAGPLGSCPAKESFFGAVRRRTFICCRNVQISASSAARERIRSTTIQPISLQRSLMAQQHRPILYQLPARQGLGQGQPDSSSNARTSCPLSLTRDRNRRATDSSDLRRFSRSLRYAPAAFPAAIQRSKVRAENAHQAPAFSGVCFSSMTGRVGARSAFNPTQCAHSGGRSASS